MTDNYLLVTYKPSSADYCRNCLMATYDSDHTIDNMLTKERLIKLLEKVVKFNLQTRAGEAPYEIYIFKNGVKIWDNGYACWDDDDDENYDYEKINKDLSEIYDLLKK